MDRGFIEQLDLSNETLKILDQTRDQTRRSVDRWGYGSRGNRDPARTGPIARGSGTAAASALPGSSLAG